MYPYCFYLQIFSDYNSIENSSANMKRYLKEHMNEFSTIALAIDWYFFYSNNFS